MSVEYLNEVYCINFLYFLKSVPIDLENLHKLEYCHKDFNSVNILQIKFAYLSDFGLSRPANEQRSDGKIYRILPYIALKALNGEPYIKASDIYSLGIVIAKVSSEKPPFYDKKHDFNLSLAICNGLCPEFVKN